MDIKKILYSQCTLKGNYPFDGDFGLDNEIFDTPFLEGLQDAQMQGNTLIIKHKAEEADVYNSKD